MSRITNTIIEDGKEYKVEIYENGTIYWLLNNKCHREKGPAFFNKENGYKYWKQYSCLHRLDGPAVIYPSGTKYWFVNGIDVTELAHIKVRTMLAFGLDKK
jgi:hypothetical protein